MGTTKPRSRREAGNMEIGKATGAWDVETARNTRLPKWAWWKAAHIAAREAAAGKKSSRTRQKVSSNDVLLTALELLFKLDEAQHGPIPLPAVPPKDAPGKAAKKAAAKKGGK